MNVVEMDWKKIQDEEREVKYHLAGEEFVDEIIVKEGEKEFSIKYEILFGEPYDLLIIQTSNPHNRIVIYLEKGPNTEDPLFTYPTFFENTNAEEIIRNIKSYILDIISYMLNLS